MRKWKLIFFAFILAGFFLPGFCVLARENIVDWYIQDFESEIKINLDSSLDITEKITADCGILSGKHGIFRVLPEEINLQNGSKIKTPVKIESITDFSGASHKFTQTRNSSDKTVTWKIGDPNRTVTGVNYYEIRYRVENAIRFQDNFDEFYWNLNGNFWDLETDHFKARIIFPEEINQKNTAVEYYAGFSGEKKKDLAQFRWNGPNVLEFESTRTLKKREGITASVVFPKNIFTPYVPGFFEKYGEYFFSLIPIAVFMLCFFIWRKYGKDPKVDKTIIAQYDITGNLSPIETGMLMKSGSFRNELITAEIINLAVLRMITIKEIKDKILFFSFKDHEFSKSANPELESKLNKTQKAILKALFEEGDSVKLSSLKNKFYKDIPKIKESALSLLKDKKLVFESGLYFRIGIIVVSILLFFSGFMSAFVSLFLSVSLILSGVATLVFGILMPKRTLLGANLNWEIKGFKLFMETVDKHRAEFYEKENIFEKFLPYAIVFGITKLWIKKMKEIYGEEYFASHAPVWYIGSSSAFSADSLTSAMDSLSSSIAASTSSSSGSGGGGFSGGGGGGGGGGGW